MDVASTPNAMPTNIVECTMSLLEMGHTPQDNRQVLERHAGLCRDSKEYSFLDRGEETRDRFAEGCPVLRARSLFAIPNPRCRAVVAADDRHD